MLTSPDFKELLSLFRKYDVHYLIVGGYAVMRYTEPRFTKHLDILIAIDDGNVRAVYTALSEFSAPLFTSSQTSPTASNRVGDPHHADNGDLLEAACKRQPVPTA